MGLFGKKGVKWVRFAKNRIFSEYLITTKVVIPMVNSWFWYRFPQHLVIERLSPFPSPAAASGPMSAGRTLFRADTTFPRSN
jgi:hypothetical protein